MRLRLRCHNPPLGAIRTGTALLSDNGWTYPASPDPIQRLLENGVLRSWVVGPDTLLSFTMASAAEFLGAMSWAQECGGNESRWVALYDQLRAKGASAAGFRLALQLTVDAYGHHFGWTPPPIGRLEGGRLETPGQL
jgi:hypothetical protein